MCHLIHKYWFLAYNFICMINHIIICICIILAQEKETNQFLFFQFSFSCYWQKLVCYPNMLASLPALKFFKFFCQNNGGCVWEKKIKKKNIKDEVLSWYLSYVLSSYLSDTKCYKISVCLLASAKESLIFSILTWRTGLLSCLYSSMKIFTWWSTHYVWIPHDDPCLYPQITSFCFHLV